MQDPFQESSEHPKLTAINAKLRERQEAQETREREVKTELVQKAANYLEDFYKVTHLPCLRPQKSPVNFLQNGCKSDMTQR